MWWQISTAIIVAILAILASVDFQGVNPGISPNKSPEGLKDKKAEEPRIKHETYVIGDLHGDVDCAKHWVRRIGVVDDVDNPRRWLHQDATLVFMGDYIDKGPFSYQTMLFVKSLTDAFPDKVTALMGNHEMEALKDRHPRRLAKFYHYSYSVVHPSEFPNFVALYRELDRDDDLVVDLLLNASLEIYARGMHRTAKFAPTSNSGPCVVDFVHPHHHRDLVKERLTEYQRAYERAFHSNTTLGKWVETLKVAHVENGVLFTHGGIDTGIAEVINKFDSIDELNRHVAENAGNERFMEFLHSTESGQAVEKMLFHRGNHKRGACPEIRDMLGAMKGVNRLAVGHTPDENIRQSCGGLFLALDSLLGRWIRTSGNYYCPTKARKAGNFYCPTLEPKCLGQIVKIDNTGKVSIIEPDSVDPASNSIVT